MSLSTVGQSVFTWMSCLFLFRLSFLSYSPRDMFLFRSSCFLDRILVLNLDLPHWIKVEGRLIRFLERSDMDQQVVTVDQFTAAMASIQEALASLRQEISGQQSRPPVA